MQGWVCIYVVQVDTSIIHPIRFINTYYTNLSPDRGITTHRAEPKLEHENGLTPAKPTLQILLSGLYNAFAKVDKHRELTFQKAIICIQAVSGLQNSGRESGKYESTPREREITF